MSAQEDELVSDNEQEARSYHDHIFTPVLTIMCLGTPRCQRLFSIQGCEDSADRREAAKETKAKGRRESTPCKKTGNG
jgi:hypothetical protein